MVDHAVEYVNGKIHTNGMENFWSLLKRGRKGTYISVEPFHLFRYLDEQVFRFNNRRMTDSERFSLIVSGVVGKRITFNELTGKEVGNSGAPQLRKTSSDKNVASGKCCKSSH